MGVIQEESVLQGVILQMSMPIGMIPTEECADGSNLTEDQGR